MNQLAYKSKLLLWRLSMVTQLLTVSILNKSANYIYMKHDITYY